MLLVSKRKKRKLKTRIKLHWKKNWILIGCWVIITKPNMNNQYQPNMKMEMILNQLLIKTLPKLIGKNSKKKTKTYKSVINQIFKMIIKINHLTNQLI